MNLNQRGAPFRFQYAIDQIQCDLGWIDTQLGTVISPAFFQRAENVADYNQIAAGTFMLSAASLMLKKVCSEWKDCELFL